MAVRRVSFFPALLAYHLVVLLALAPRAAQAITCSVCNSVYNEDCKTSPEKYVKECEPPPQYNDSDHPPFCRKATLNVYKPELPQRVYRSCAYLKDPQNKNCRDYYPAGMNLKVCQCFSDACNAAPPSPQRRLYGAIWTWLPTMAAILAVFR
ncbi:uncharacterized protein LOC144111165 [Amblyomma americanum]